MWTEISITGDHCLASFGNPRDAKQWHLGQIFLSTPYTHERYLYSHDMDAAWSGVSNKVRSKPRVPNNDPRDRFFYPHPTPMNDSHDMDAAWSGGSNKVRSKPRDAERWPSGQIFLSTPYTHEWYLYSHDMDAAWSGVSNKVWSPDKVAL